MSIEKTQHKHNGLIVAGTTVAGAAIGGHYGYNHLPESSKTVLKELHSAPKEITDKMQKAFNLENATKAFEEKNITEDEFKRTSDVISDIEESIAKEKEYANFEKKSVKAAREINELELIKTVNAAFHKMLVSIDSLKDIMPKLGEHNIVNNKIIEETIKKYINRAPAIFKAFAIPTAIGVGMGAAAGLAIGGVINMFRHSASD